MHLISVTNTYYGSLVSSTEVRNMMDRHNIQSGIGFYFPPVFGRQVEIDAVLQAVKDLDDRLVTLLMPPPFDLGFTVAFMGFAVGTYTTSLLEPWYPPNGPFEGFGEIAFYYDDLRSLTPASSQLDNI